MVRPPCSNLHALQVACCDGVYRPSFKFRNVQGARAANPLVLHPLPGQRVQPATDHECSHALNTCAQFHFD